MSQQTRVMALFVRLEWMVDAKDNDTTSEYTLLNYQTAVATSFQTLEDDITKQYPNLKRAPKQDLRSYVKLLQSQFPKLTDTICDNYVMSQRTLHA